MTIVPAQGPTLVLNLSGTATAKASAIQFSPAALDFGESVVGGKIAAKSVTITNAGATSVGLSGVAAMNAPAYEVVADQCSGRSLAPHASCVVSISYSPTANGAEPGLLRVVDSVSGSPQVYSLTGQGRTLSLLGGGSPHRTVTGLASQQ